MKIRLILLIVICQLSISLCCAQNRPEATLQVDLVSRYMWRGQQLSGAALQPTAELSWKGAYVGVWGSMPFDNSESDEIDLNIGYRAPFGLNIGITDYWSSGVAYKDIYMGYKKQHTAHQFEGNIGYSCKYGSLQAYTYFWGNDYKLDGKQAFSTYIELGIPFTLAGVDFTAMAGVVPFKGGYGMRWSNEHAIYYYDELNYDTDGFACTMAALRAEKELSLGFMKLPIFVEVHTNPYLQTANIMAGLSFKAF